MKEEWNQIKKCVEDPAEKVIGKKNAWKINEWFDQCKEVLQKKKEARLEWLRIESEADYQKKTKLN